MFAVYLCGPTDCFLSAMFMHEKDAEKWGEEKSKPVDGWFIRFWESPKDIDRSDTGWEE